MFCSIVDSTIVDTLIQEYTRANRRQSSCPVTQVLVEMWNVDASEEQVKSIKRILNKSELT